MPRDLKHFAAITKGHTVIMGRNTYESIMASLGKPLPNRNNIVVTRNHNFQAAGCTVVHSLEEAFNQASPRSDLKSKKRSDLGDSEVFVIGGSQLYTEALLEADKIYRTLIHTTIEGDAFFPTLSASDWQLTTSHLEPKDDKNPFDATYEVYIRKN
ncbi:MAG: Dihydrofolate reductase [Parcubacteria group bacterium GW2011_GWA2_47_16]|nr:MAG: Dihydrofolate reductase [Parcubacteria group bacterium GW2011_GWA2_47_16]